MKTLFQTVGLLVSCLLAIATQAASPQQYIPPSSNPEHLYAFKDFIYFQADDGLHGAELWRVNLQGEKMKVKDITPGSSGSHIDAFGGIRDVLYFQVDDPEFGRELWRTDGTEAGTWRVKRFDFGPGKGFNQILGEIRGRILLGVSDGNFRLWSTDGTEEGTRPFVEEGSKFQFIGGIKEIVVPNGDYMYFSCEYVPGAFGVFRSDGTAAGTIMLCNSEREAQHFFRLDGVHLLFECESNATGWEPWITDGTPENTRMLTEINPGPAHGVGGLYYGINNGKDKPIAIFMGSSPDKPNELWLTDGTAEGTRPFLETEAGPGTTLTDRMVTAQQFLYFIGRDAANGSEIWMAAPYKNQIMRVSDANPGPADADPYAFCLMVNTNLIFSANNAEFGEEPWVAGYGIQPARMLEDIYPGPGSSYPSNTVELDGQIVFSATDPVHGRELWVSNGQSGARLLADIYSDSSINPSSSPGDLTAVGSILYFVANDIIHGSEPWRTDGTPGGTRMVRDVLPGRASSGARELTAADGWLYFSAEDGSDGVRLWRSDGTEAGTVVVDRIAYNPQYLTAFKGELFYSATEDDYGRELRRVSHTGISGRVRDIASRKASSNPRNLVVGDPFLYFLADDGVRGEELWRSDGTEEGTIMVRDIVEKPYEPLSLGELSSAGGKLFFAGKSSSLGEELWVFDPGRLTAGPVFDIAAVDALLLARPPGAATVKK